jgi:hypothetical protein
MIAGSISRGRAASAMRGRGLLQRRLDHAANSDTPSRNMKARISIEIRAFIENGDAQLETLDHDLPSIFVPKTNPCRLESMSNA